MVMPLQIASNNTVGQVPPTLFTSNVPASFGSSGFAFIGPVCAVFVYPSGHVQAVFRAGATHVSAGDYGVIQVADSYDGGATWQSAITILSENRIDLRNVGGGVLPDGRAILGVGRYNPDTGTWLSLDVWASDDEGVTWARTNQFLAGQIPGSQGYSGFSWNQKLIPLGSNTFGIPWYEASGTSSSALHIMKTQDRGQSWSDILIVNTTTAQYNQPLEHTVVHIGGGRMVCVARTGNPTGHMWWFTSSNGGTTWTSIGNMDSLDSGSSSMTMDVELIEDAAGPDPWVLLTWNNASANTIKYVLGRGATLVAGALDWTFFPATTLSINSTYAGNGTVRFYRGSTRGIYVNTGNETGLKLRGQNVIPHSKTPKGVLAITVGGSPFTYTNNDLVPEMVYISGGTLTTPFVRKNGITIFGVSNVGVFLWPGEFVTVTYSAAPTMTKDLKWSTG